MLVSSSGVQNFWDCLLASSAIMAALTRSFLLLIARIVRPWSFVWICLLPLASMQREEYGAVSSSMMPWRRIASSSDVQHGTYTLYTKLGSTHKRHLDLTLPCGHSWDPLHWRQFGLRLLCSRCVHKFHFLDRLGSALRDEKLWTEIWWSWNPGTHLSKSSKH